MRNILNFIIFIAVVGQTNRSCTASDERSAQAKPSQINQSAQKDFDDNYKKLKSFYKDKTIAAAFDLSQSDLSLFLRISRKTATRTAHDGRGVVIGAKRRTGLNHV